MIHTNFLTNGPKMDVHVVFNIIIATSMGMHSFRHNKY